MYGEILCRRNINTTEVVQAMKPKRTLLAQPYSRLSFTPCVLVSVCSESCRIQVPRVCTPRSAVATQDPDQWTLRPAVMTWQLAVIYADNSYVMQETAKTWFRGSESTTTPLS